MSLLTWARDGVKPHQEHLGDEEHTAAGVTYKPGESLLAALDCSASCWTPWESGVAATSLQATEPKRSGAACWGSLPRGQAAPPPALRPALPLALLMHTSWANQLITPAESKAFVFEVLLLLVVFLLLRGYCYSEGWPQGVPGRQQDVTTRPGKTGWEWW